jgi:hypothetical protein
MGTRKNPKPKKSNKRFRKTRSKRQRGGEDTPTIAELTTENEALQHQVAELSTCGDCSICREPMDNKCSKVNLLIATDCNPLPHIFHKDCLRIWCQNKATCPNCRNPIPNTCTYLSSTNILPRAATATTEIANRSEAERQRMSAAAASEREALEAEARAAAQRQNQVLRERERERIAAASAAETERRNQALRERIVAHANERLVAAAAADAYDSDADDPYNNTRVPYNNTRVPVNTGKQSNVIEQKYNQTTGRVPRKPKGPPRSGGKKRTKKTKKSVNKKKKQTRNRT